MTDRVVGLDLLRGLCAFGVATYHFSSWLGLNIVSLNVGYYAVYVFFVISGASMYLSYSKRLNELNDFENFLFIRYFRLLPLFLLVLLTGPLIQSYDLSGYNTNFWHKLPLNLLFFFGVGNPGINSLVTGGWSLGVEFIFYLLFPMFMILAKRPLFLFVIWLFQTVFVNISAIDNNWGVYIQPLAFIWYFAIGCFIAKFYLTNRIAFSFRGSQVAGLLVSLAIVAYWLLDKPSAMGQTLIGFSSISLPITCAILVWAFFTFQPKLGAAFFGRVSYGVYLLHPMVFYVLERHAAQFSLSIRFLLFLGTTALVSHLLDRYIEQPILDFAKRKFPVGRKTGVRVR